MAEHVVLGQGLLDEQQVERVELRQVARASASVYAVLASTCSSMSGRTRSRTARTGSMSQPGSIFSLMRR